jgi:hypothetical protein
MVMLRNAVMAALVGTGLTGCAFPHHGIAHYSIWHCDECDDFPTPGYGPDYSMMPGTYTGPPARESLEATQPGATSPPAGSARPANPPGTQVAPPGTQVAPPGTPVMPPGTSPMPPTTVTPPAPPAAAPDQGADARQPAGSPLDLPRNELAGAEPALPPLPGDLAVPAAQPEG